MTSARSGAGGAATAPHEKGTFTSPSIYETKRNTLMNLIQCQGLQNQHHNKGRSHEKKTVKKGCVF